VIIDLSDDVGDFLLSLCVANVGKFAHILEGVSRPGSAKLFNLTDHKAETVKVLRNLRSVCHHFEVFGKDRVDEFTVLELFVYGGVVFITWVHNSLLHEEVEFVVAGVNFLALIHLFTKETITEEGNALSLYVLKEANRVANTTLEVTNWFRHKAEVTKLLNGGRGGLCEDGLILLFEGLTANVGSFSVLHPVDGEEVTKA